MRSQRKIISHVVLNGEEVGTLGEADQAQELLIQARREIGENAG